MCSATIEPIGNGFSKEPQSWKFSTSKIRRCCSDFIEKLFNIWKKQDHLLTGHNNIKEPLTKTIKCLDACNAAKDSEVMEVKEHICAEHTVSLRQYDGYTTTPSALLVSESITPLPNYNNTCDVRQLVAISCRDNADAQCLHLERAPLRMSSCIRDMMASCHPCKHKDHMMSDNIHKMMIATIWSSTRRLSHIASIIKIILTATSSTTCGTRSSSTR